MTTVWQLRARADLRDRACVRLVEPELSAQTRIAGLVHAYVELIAPAPDFGRPQPMLSVSFQSCSARAASATLHRFAAVAIEHEGTRVNAEPSSVRVAADRTVLGEVFADFFGGDLPLAAWEKESCLSGYHPRDLK